MKRSLAQFVLLAVALWLPVQAIAMPWLALKCSDAEMGAAHVHAGVAEAQHGADARGASDSHEQEPIDQHGNGAHFCCHHFSAISSAITMERADPPGFAPAIVLVHDYRFFPEPAKRPPLPPLG